MENTLVGQWQHVQKIVDQCVAGTVRVKVIVMRNDEKMDDETMREEQ